MELNLLPILNFDGKKMDISESISYEAASNDDFQITSPITFDGVASNSGGTIELVGNASATLLFVCDRCCEEFEKNIDFHIDERFKKEDAFTKDDENPDIISFSGTSIDLSEILYTNLYMNIPSKRLCSEDCKGLCHVCGKNLNSGSCDCSGEATDPRFDILDKLL